MNPQHGLNGKRRAPTLGASTAGRKRVDPTYQFRPRYNQDRFVEEHAFAGALGNKLESGGGNDDLFHRNTTRLKTLRVAGL